MKLRIFFSPDIFYVQILCKIKEYFVEFVIINAEFAFFFQHEAVQTKWIVK